MNRLVQGDVGSGKTVVAQMAIYKMVKSGFQAVMMAPTELLAKQHLATLKRDFEPLGLNVKLLSSSTKAKERTEILTALEAGEIDVIIGTHAVIQPDVVFKNLGLDYSYEFNGCVPSGLNILRSENIIQDETQLVLKKVELALNINTIPDSEIAEKLYFKYYV
jgi:ATP-dependent DNA helicase RecG